MGVSFTWKRYARSVWHGFVPVALWAVATLLFEQGCEVGESGDSLPELLPNSSSGPGWQSVHCPALPSSTLPLKLLLALSVCLSVCLSVVQHGPRVSLGCRSSEFLDHAMAKPHQLYFSTISLDCSFRSLYEIEDGIY
jgi:hypothetical protein